VIIDSGSLSAEAGTAKFGSCGVSSKIETWRIHFTVRRTKFDAKHAPAARVQRQSCWADATEGVKSFV